MKKSKILLAIAFIATLNIVAFLDTPTASAALTKAQKQACYERWAGRATGSAAGEDAKSFDEAAFKKTNCYKERTCKIERYEDGAVIHCFNVETGEFDSENIDNRPSADPDNAETSGGCNTGCGETVEGCGDIKTSIIKCNTKGGNPLMSILIQVINFLAVGVGIAVVGGIVWGGMMYASSNGDAGKTKQGVTIIVNAVVGLLLFMFMYALINFIVPGGVFN